MPGADRSEHTRPLRMGMVGGGLGAFIGGVHRMAARLDDSARLVAGAFSSNADRSIESGLALGVDRSRCYGDWREMLERERSLEKGERIDFVSIVTPNSTHFPIALAAVEAGFHVVLDKPMVLSSDEADRLVAAVEKAGVVLCVTYNYSGYPLVKEARELIRRGVLGEVRKVIAEYNQGWLASALEETGQKQAAWRTDPALAGLGGAIGDIGSHAEQLVSCITGLEFEAVCADLNTFVAGRALDDDASLLLRFRGGARGTLSASQVCVGAENELSIRVYGTEGGLAWRQEEPNRLDLWDADGTQRTLRRGSGSLSRAAQSATRLPPGHPEAFIEAFANVYREATAAMHRHSSGGSIDGDYPTVRDGARGVRFIEAAVRSSRSDQKWTPLSG